LFVVLFLFLAQEYQGKENTRDNKTFKQNSEFKFQSKAESFQLLEYRTRMETKTKIHTPSSSYDITILVGWTDTIVKSWLIGLVILSSSQKLAHRFGDKHKLRRN
jgi:hypothetical protein